MSWRVSQPAEKKRVLESGSMAADTSVSGQGEQAVTGVGIVF